MTVSLRNPRTGEIKVLRDGWCWSCFFGSGILGLPLFRLGLQVQGAAMVAFNVVALAIGLVPTGNAVSLDVWLTVIGIGLCVFFGLKANEMAIQRYLAHGWEYAEPRRRWA
jgi:hypothetical protein